MRSLLVTIMVVSGVLFIASVLLMSPKGGLGIAVGGSGAGGSEYGSKKSIEGKLKKTAIISIVIFAASALFLPYI